MTAETLALLEEAAHRYVHSLFDRARRGGEGASVTMKYAGEIDRAVVDGVQSVRMGGGRTLSVVLAGGAVGEWASADG